MKLTATYKFKMIDRVPEGDSAILLTCPDDMGYHKWLNHYLKHAIISFEARLAWIDNDKAMITVPAEIVEEVVADAEEYDITATEAELPSALVPEEVQDDIINAVEACIRPDRFNLFEVTPAGDATVQMQVIDKIMASSIQSAFILSGARVDFD